MALCEVTGDRFLAYAYYADEIGPDQACAKKGGLKISRFTRDRHACAELFAESSCGTAPNPLANPALPFPETRPKRLGDPKLFEKLGHYMVYVSKTLWKRARSASGGSKPEAEITLFLGVGPEMALFGLRSFFENSESGAVITVPGVEAGWKGYGAAWGIGIDARIIEALLKRAGLRTFDWKVKVIAGFSTGYRGFNGIVANAEKLGIDLSQVERGVFFDCLYKHDDHARNNAEPAYAKRFTQRAIDTLIAANPAVAIAVYRVTTAGTPRGRSAKGLLAEIPTKNLVLVDLLENKKGRFDQLRALFLARFLQNALEADLVQPKDLASPILEFVRLLPERGTLVTGRARTGQQRLDDWLARPDLKLRMRELYGMKQGNQLLIQHMINLSLQHGLLSGWESSDWHDMMHRYFVQELGKQHLV
jgi:hypothetical protein